jgi:hypothetical protein
MMDSSTSNNTTNYSRSYPTTMYMVWMMVMMVVAHMMPMTIESVCFHWHSHS